MYQCFLLTYFLWETLGVGWLSRYVKKIVNMIFTWFGVEKCPYVVMKYVVEKMPPSSDENCWGKIWK